MKRIKKFQKFCIKGEILQLIRKQGVKNAVFLFAFLHFIILVVITFAFEVIIYEDMTQSMFLSFVVYLATGPCRLYLFINLIHHLDNLSLTDNLTGAYNRRFLMMQLGKKFMYTKFIFHFMNVEC